MLQHKRAKIVNTIDNITVDRYNDIERRRNLIMLNQLMRNKNITKYRLSKDSGVPYTTVNDICSGKAQVEKCSADTIYRIAKVLGVSMESIIEPFLEKRIDFELFKSNVCHRLKELGDYEFVIETLEQDEISIYHKKKWYPESLYLLAMLDYVSRENEIPFCTKYDDMRNMKLREMLYPRSVLIAEKINNDNKAKEQAVSEAIPEFLRFNIVESEVRNIV